MKLVNQKRLAGDVLKCSTKRVWFDKERLADIKEAITKIDIKTLIKDKAIAKKPVKSVSRVRARKIQKQKKAGRRKGHGSRKGTHNAREGKKTIWMNLVRTQRGILKKLKERDLIPSSVYRDLYSKSKGGFFRSKKHLKLYIEEKNLIKEK